jgi:uncharacterized protein (TIGR00106 family)
MKEQVIAEITVSPLGTGDTSLSKYVAGCLKIAREAPGISCELTAMGTTIQGPLERVFEVVRKMHEAPFALGAKRVLTTIRIDDRRDKLATMEGKVRAVRNIAHSQKINI